MEGTVFYIHILKVPPHERGGRTLPPLLLGHSFPPYKPNQQDQNGGGTQNNLEIYRNLEGAKYTSPVQKYKYSIMNGIFIANML